MTRPSRSKLLRQLDRVLGFRGSILLAFSVGLLAYGVSSITDPAPATSPFMVYTLLPPAVRGLLWIVPAVLAGVAAFRKPGQSDAVGFAAASLPMVTITISYISATVGQIFGIDTTTNTLRGWTWAVLLFVLLRVSRQPEVHEVKPHVTDVRQQTVFVLEETREEAADD